MGSLIQHALGFVIAFGLLILPCAEGGAVWNEASCSTEHEDNRGFYVGNISTIHGVVTDAVCCNTTYYDGANCEKLDNKYDCKEENRCHWKEAGEGGPKCADNRDEHNNVCCRPEQVKENCKALLQGKCPNAWQIPHECCPEQFNKYTGVLATNSIDLACCNAPCTAIEMVFAGNETLNIVANKSCTADMSVNCGPNQRSAFSNMNMFGNSNINPLLLSSMMGFPVDSSMKVGQNMGNSIFGQMESVSGDLANLYAVSDMMTGGDKAQEEVEEITVDDFFNALIESLDNDKDVFEYNRDIYSDKIFGKQSIGGFDPFAGGMLGMMSALTQGSGYNGYQFPDSNNFFNPLYSSNPAGPGMAEMLFGSSFGLPSSSFSGSTNPWTFPGMSKAANTFGNYELDPLYYQEPIYQCTDPNPTYVNYYYDYAAAAWKKCPSYDQQSKDYQCKQAVPPYPGQYYHYPLKEWKQCKLSPEQEPAFQCQQPSPPSPGYFYDYEENRWTQCPILPHQQPSYQCNNPLAQYQGYYYDYRQFQWLLCSSLDPREETENN